MAELAPRRGPLLGPRWADWAEILRGKQARVWLQMIQISLGWVEVGRHSGQKTEKNVKNRRFWPGLPDGASDCLALCGRSRPKFYVVSGLGYGYWSCAFRWSGSRYAGAMGKKRVKIDGFCRF